MSRYWYILTAFCLLSFTACQESNETSGKSDKAEDDVFPEVRKLSEFEKTDFLPTLESEFSNESNGIYAASLLMAWDEIKMLIADPITEFTSDELALMNVSKTYQEVLKPEEYRSSVEVQEGRIMAKAYFRKSLPFEYPLEQDPTPLIFNGDSVKSFGFSGHDDHPSRIIYYHNDNDFAIRLIPKDYTHEIILIKSDFPDKLVLKDEVDKLAKRQQTFDQNRTDQNSWKHYYNDDDHVRIPIIEYNIETNYANIEGSRFSTSKQGYNVDKVYQRTAFILDEKGAEVESEAVMNATTEEMIEEEIPKPKYMMFDKPYIVMLKREDSDYPYFAMYVCNGELMRPFEK